MGGSAATDGGCLEGGTKTAPCGLHGNGDQLHVCTAGAWTKAGECNDPDIVVSLDSDGVISCAVNRGGRVACWGSAPSGQFGKLEPWVTAVPTNVPGVAGAVAVTLGMSHVCALLESGKVTCWGSNSSGQLGNGEAQYWSLPVQAVGVSEAVAVGAGTAFTCSLLKTGEVLCWGLNSSGQLGHGAIDDSLSPVKVVELDEVTDIGVGDDFVCAVKKSGEVACWGANGWGQLGTDPYATPKPVTVPGISDALAA